MSDAVAIAMKALVAALILTVPVFAQDAPKSSDFPVKDPTENVAALMKASLEALKELRLADDKFNGASYKHLEDMAELRAKYAELIRASDLEAANKTRQVDVLAAASSATALATAVSALQGTTDRNAETLRNSVISSAATIAKQTSDAALATQTSTDNLFRRMDERMSLMERNAAVGAGRQSVSDPAMEAMNLKLQTLLESRATVSGKSEGADNVWAYILGGAGLLFGAIGAVIALVTIAGNRKHPNHQ